MTVNEWLNDNELGVSIWQRKYQHNNETFEQWLDRVSQGNQSIRELIKDKKFLFGGRILANRGLPQQGIKVTYSNCYVLATNDSIEGIFNTGAQMARTFSYGGGVGIDISPLRPSGAKVHNAAKTTSGAVSFMDFFSYVTGLIGQNGRRGALMLSLRCDHPDLEQFINIKADPNACTKANISVMVSDKFMEAVEAKQPWELRYELADGEVITKTVDAHEIFMLLAKRNWEMAEPKILGIIYANL